jgi:MYXO-CTERM domain-containing protein
MLDQASGQLFCTGTLIHPQVVLFAAHCMDPDDSWATPGTIMFGEDVASPVRPIPVADCVVHPDWDSAGIDLAACTLPVAVHHIPIAPLLAGCEVDALQPGTVVTIVGFGATNGLQTPEGDIITAGVGHKRFTQQTITDVFPQFNDVVMVGPDTGGCFGDSGGPAFVQLSDGTWRVFGAASTLHPESVPDENGELCGLGTVYEIAYNHLDWLESFSGFDLTPCHNVDGTWNPGPDCRDFPLTPAIPESTWQSGCEAENIGSWSRTCGPAFGETPPPPPPPPPVPDPVPVPLPDDTGKPPLEDTDTDTDVDTAGEDDGKDRGCTCNEPGTAPPALALLALLALRRRRRA